MRFINALVACSVIAITSSSVLAQSTAVQWTVASGGNGHWYALSEEAIPLSRAEIMAAAVAKGAQPIMLATKAEELFVYAQFGFTLLGNSADAGSSAFTWMADPGNTYSNWGTGACSSGPYPNNPTNNERFAYLQSANCPGTQNIATQWDDYQLSESPSSIRILFEWSADCNSDGIVDYGQILSGQLIDANGDGIPDVCQQLVPIHQFDFDTDLHDSVGAATGQFKGNCRVENGALIADGTDSYVEFDQYLIPSTGSVTVAMWVKSELGQGIHEFISQGTYNGSFYVGRNFMATDRFRVGDDWMQTNTPYDWICGAWHHVAVVVNRTTDRTQLWVDAQLKEERIGAITIPSVGLKTRLCAQYCCGEFFRGKLDQLRIYASALTGPTLAEIVATSGYPCPGDISGNNSVDGVDLAAILGTWGTNGQGEFDCDIDNDGIVGGTDLTIILGGWGPCPN